MLFISFLAFNSCRNFFIFCFNILKRKTDESVRWDKWIKFYWFITLGFVCCYLLYFYCYLLIMCSQTNRLRVDLFFCLHFCVLTIIKYSSSIHRYLITECFSYWNDRFLYAVHNETPFFLPLTVTFHTFPFDHRYHWSPIMINSYSIIFYSIPCWYYRLMWQLRNIRWSTVL